MPDPQPDLFGALDATRRERLLDMGWQRAGFDAFTRPLWYVPDRSHAMPEEQAFRWLDRQDAAGTTPQPGGEG